jgi:hypothetical protein
MRYYRNALLFSGFTHSIYSIGSCFAVKAGAYVAQGGMNRRKAGEDFYFLHKMTMLGEIGEINSTTVYPSSRISTRVPFGTGPALEKYCKGDQSLEYSYSLKAFEILRSFFSVIEMFYKKEDKLLAEDFSKNVSFIQFCKETRLVNELCELIENCASLDVFRKRFFHLFNAFKVLKWLNFSVQNGFPKAKLLDESQKLLLLLGIEENLLKADAKILLTLFRSLDKNRASD